MPATTPTSPFIPEIPDNSRFKGCHTFSSLYHLLSQQTEIPRLCTFPINTRCRISGNTFPRFPIIPEIPDNSRFKGCHTFSSLYHLLSQQTEIPRLCTFPINTRCRISGNTFPTTPITPIQKFGQQKRSPSNEELLFLFPLNQSSNSGIRMRSSVQRPRCHPDLLHRML